MRILFCHDTYYFQDNKKTYAYGAFPYALWAERFLPHCDALRVIGRKKIDEDNPLGLDISSGADVSFCLLDNINTPFKRLFGAQETYRTIYDEVRQSDLVVIRGPVEFGMMAAKAARMLGKPYVVEMSGCAFDHSWYHGSLIGKLYAPLKYLRARHMVRHADAVLYVTQHFLQRRYPHSKHCVFASNVEIEPVDKKILERRLSRMAGDKITFGLIGNHSNYLKGLPVILKSLCKIKDQLPDFQLRVLGQGNPQKWHRLIHTYGLEDYVHFDGVLPGGKPVLDWLDSIDIYLQPSYHEGLPRAVIEAMSRGCPALTSNAGGTDELLAAEFIHSKGDADMLARHILNMLPVEMRREQAAVNFEVAKGYTKDVLKPRREAFYRGVIAGLKK